MAANMESPDIAWSQKEDKGSTGVYGPNAYIYDFR